MAPRISVIMEYENATTHEGDEAAPIFVALLRQYAGRAAPAAEDRDELLLVYDPSDQDGDDIDRVIDSAAPGVRSYLDISRVPTPGARYYELKNAGAEVARGEILIFLDSDLEPEDGWLDTLMAPFDDPDTTAACGYTYLGHSDFLSRTFALTWVFPLRDDSQREIDRRPLYANNWAVRRSWFMQNPFPYNAGFKVGCSLLAANLKAQNVELKKVMAYGRHKPLEGVRFMMWRAAVAGRDDDNRYAILGSPDRSARVSRAFTRWIKQLMRSARRVVTRHGSVDMPVYQVPAAVAVGWLYYTIFFAAQLRSALSGPRQEPERIPEFVVHH